MTKIIENVEVNWMEAFFVLAILVAEGDTKRAKSYIQTVIERPRLVTRILE